MKEYDIFIAGGGIAGSVTAKYSTRGGLNTLFIEKYKTPRQKSCSGIQFGYFEKILGEKIPPKALCTNKINKVEMYFPNGKKLGAPFKMFNFMRDDFDHWLNKVAIREGAEFRDECSIIDWEEVDDGVVVTINNEDEDSEKIKTEYLIDATGLNPKIRMKMRPDDFETRSSGATVNYYIDGEADLDPHKLYQFWNIEYNNMMFAWIYKKSDLWVVGTGYDKGIAKIGKKFYEYCKKKFNIQGEIVKKEGYSSTIDFSSENRVWLGTGKILMTGDAAGLIDLTRGVGMDAAALSGRLLAKALIKAKKEGKDALEIYTNLMRKLSKQTQKHQGQGIIGIETNEELMKYLRKNMLKMGLGMVFQNFFNKFRSIKNLRMLPP